MTDTQASAIVAVQCDRISRDAESRTERAIPAETPIAFTYDHATYAVMMASPSDLEDFAVGFSLAERIVKSENEITDLAIVTLQQGIELRMSLAISRKDELEKRRRRVTGPAGCGLCGIESLEGAMAMPPTVRSNLKVAPEIVFSALSALEAHQHMNARTRAVHAAGFWSAHESKFTVVREDVGRHNALDKLIGAISRSGADAANGFIVITSRVSIELVQKAAAAGCPLLVGVSAPTAFAVEAAAQLNLTLVGVARDDAFEVFAHPQRIATAPHDG